MTQTEQATVSEAFAAIDALSAQMVRQVHRASDAIELLVVDDGRPVARPGSQ